jgi:hypothetical protein
MFVRYVDSACSTRLDDVVDDVELLSSRYACSSEALSTPSPLVSYLEMILSALDVELVVELSVSEDSGGGGGGGAIPKFCGADMPLASRND